MSIESLIVQFEKHKNILQTAAAFLAAAFVGMWIFQPAPEAPKQIKLTSMIPKGFVLVPLTLKNSNQLAPLIEDRAVIDIYRGDQIQIRYLRILKVNKGEQSHWAALIPENFKTNLREPLSRSEMSGVIRPDESPPTEFLTLKKARSLLLLLNN
ncbi:MAG: hypothetical protein IT289_03075 [Oligoflexia bacterium]|nr:hypothetical protein [Oligoflexia bacterium]